MSIADKEIEIIEDFDIYDDWMEKYEYIIELGKDLPIINDVVAPCHEIFTMPR